MNRFLEVKNQLLNIEQPADDHGSNDGRPACIEHVVGIVVVMSNVPPDWY